MKKAKLFPIASLLISLASLSAVLSAQHSLNQERASLNASIMVANKQPVVEVPVASPQDGLERYTRCQDNWCVTDFTPVEPW